MRDLTQSDARFGLIRLEILDTSCQTVYELDQACVITHQKLLS